MSRVHDNLRNATRQPGTAAPPPSPPPARPSASRPASLPSVLVRDGAPAAPAVKPVEPAGAAHATEGGPADAACREIRLREQKIKEGILRLQQENARLRALLREKEKDLARLRA